MLSALLQTFGALGIIASVLLQLNPVHSAQGQDTQRHYPLRKRLHQTRAFQQPRRR